MMDSCFSKVQYFLKMFCARYAPHGLSNVAEIVVLLETTPISFGCFYCKFKLANLLDETLKCIHFMKHQELDYCCGLISCLVVRFLLC